MRLSGLLADRRFEHVFADGRIHLLRGEQRYDIIEADALRPKSAYAGNLYSEDIFALLRDRLKPGGLAATWVPTRVRTAFMKVFPYVMSLPDILIGSSQPIVFDREAVAARLSDPRVQHHEVAGIDIDDLLGRYLQAPVIYGPGEGRDSQAETNTDLFPRDEYDRQSDLGRMRKSGRRTPVPFGGTPGYSSGMKTIVELVGLIARRPRLTPPRSRHRIWPSSMPGFSTARR